MITSPPYAEQLVNRGGNQKINQQKNRPHPYSTDPNQIGQMPLGQIDEVITSPPYEQSEAFLDTDFMKKAAVDQEANFRMLKHKTGGHVSRGHSRSAEAEERYLTKMENGRIENPDNIGKLKGGDIDAIVTSLPYDEGTGHSRSKSDDKLLHEKGIYLKDGSSYGISTGQIGQLKKQTYLQAMFEVYTQMFSVLKEGGRAVIVIKPFARNKKPVDLPYQTWLLLKKVGFQLEDVLKLYLKNLSFWRVLQYKRDPTQEQIRHEYVLVIRKEAR